MMNYRFIYILLIVSTFSMYACKDEFLTNLPETVVSAEDFYQTESDFEQAVIGMYVPLRTLFGSGLADYGAWAMGEMRSDNTIFIYNQANRGYADREYVDQFVDDANGGAVANKYENNYILIGRANQILQTIDDADFDQTQKDNFKGQALFMRSFAYFDLVQYFGDVPLVLAPPTSYEETANPRVATETIYTQIIEDLTLAAELLPASADQDAGFVASGAAYTLLGNIYLVLEEWANAESTLLQVTGYSLLDDYAAIFDPSNKNNAESIFEIQYTDDPTASSASNFAYNFLPILSDPGVIEGFPNGSSNSYAGWNIPTPEMVAAYEEGDLRLDASVGFYTGDGYENIPYVKKYVHGADIAPNTNDDWPVYRYAEVLLMIAEAKNEQGKGDALDYLNMVHAHTRTGLEAITTTDQAELRELILHERRIELAFENKRWLDLVRTDNAVEVMTAHFANILADPVTYYYPEGVDPVSGSYQMSTDRLLFPIPQREIRVNSEISQDDQNPGY
ncbi:RagB/SusD family nutrient uptake outer membrane protein [Chondrinema litorale]|uniref:RagB/SusD family nutrient uptake outer membrane protein n=1 Tax=Chondrinema litorale TaxID=2994555 RepID=UPI00254374A8|nr:RagB/SusD family nutrient uptake outer membrane protein [Chondrinema litorale]UZR97377.1 RagB/SusD family nutrient uptake outer membrane protein [Chondrinema litorale]